MRAITLLPLAAALFVLVPGPASAIYIETPLTLTPGAIDAEVGDVLGFEVAPQPENETAAADWAGKTVRVVLSYEREHEEGDEVDVPYAHDVVDNVTLDEKAHARFSWTVPEALDDKNVNVLLEAEDGTLLAQAHVSVGDAEPVMQVLASGSGPAPDEGEVAPPENRPAEVEDPQPRADDTNAVSAVGAIAAIGGLAALALVLRRR